MLLHDFVDSAAEEAGTARSVRSNHIAWTYRELAELSEAFAGWLRTRGVGRADRVVVQLPPTPELAAMMFGCSRRGAMFVPVDPAMKPFHLGAVLQDTEPSLAITSDDLVQPMRQVTSHNVHGLSSVWGEVAMLRGQAEAGAHVHPQDVAMLIYTSGSSAMPKAVVCPHEQVTFAVTAIDAVLRYRAEDIVLSRLPMFWDYGLYQVLLCCLRRSELVLAHEHADLLLPDLIRDTEATVVPVVPSLASMIVTLAQRDPDPVTRVRLITNTGATLPMATIEALRHTFPAARIVRQFGQTECKRIAIMPPEQDRERPDSVGRPLPGTTVRAVDANGCSLPPGRTGEIVVTGPHVMAGYWRSPELTARTYRIGRDGSPQLHTGDYGYLDEDGYLYFTGRRDNIFKRNGVRMSTVEIEAAAMDIPGVRAAAAFPPATKRDLTVCVETDLAPHTVLREMSRRLEPAKVPASCVVLPAFPLTPHGKHETRTLALMIEGVDR
jgi:acyl-CoA synthetase (AMP-forming)/AMP-acid ligase II